MGLFKEILHLMSKAKFDSVECSQRLGEICLMHYLQWKLPSVSRFVPQYHLELTRVIRVMEMFYKLYCLCAVSIYDTF